MKASDYIARFLTAQGVPQVFEVVGGMIAQLLDSMHVLSAPRAISVHHEQGAAFAAEGLARMTGIPGVALATSGPGATNLLTGIGSCYFDSTPSLFLTGQVNRSERKGDRAVRQLGFQETDIVSMAAPITKACFRVEDALEIPVILERAVRSALSGRPGPVLVDIPMAVQRGDIPDSRVETIELSTPVEPSHDLVAEALETLRRAERPLILVGGGIRSGRATLELEPEQRFLTSGGMGAMGFGLPAAIGASFTVPGQPVVVIAGDGGFQLNIQELETVRRNGLPLKIVLFNNRCHGMVRQFQQSYFEERYDSTLWGYSAPDFERVAAAYDIPAATIEREEQISGALSGLFGSSGAPALLQVMIDTFTNAYPKRAFGRPMTEMEPIAKPMGMEGIKPVGGLRYVQAASEEGARCMMASTFLASALIRTATWQGLRERAVAFGAPHYANWAVALMAGTRDGDIALLDEKTVRGNANMVGGVRFDAYQVLVLERLRVWREPHDAGGAEREVANGIGPLVAEIFWRTWRSIAATSDRSLPRAGDRIRGFIPGLRLLGWPALPALPWLIVTFVPPKRLRSALMRVRKRAMGGA